MKKKLPILIIFLVGVGVLLYPIVSNVLAGFTQTRVISNYEEAVSSLSQDEKNQELEKANQYNSNLINSSEEVEGVSYVDLLNIGEVMAYLEIPKIKVKLPIYHGTSDAVLERGIGHMEKSSLPVGGSSTHAVLTGHTGLPQAMLLTDLTKLEVGDSFYIHLFDEVLAYQVNQIKVVLPEETSDLQIIEGEDYVTLITCTPYGVNTHRLLIRGTRVEEVESEEEETSCATESQSSSKKEVVDSQNQLLMNSKIYLVLGVITLIGTILFIVRRRKRGR